MIILEKRPQPSRAWSLVTPVAAVLATMVFGGILFAVLGKNPVEAIRTIFWDPLFGEFAFYYRPQMLVKGAPLVLIAIGLSLGFKAGIWNIGAEGQLIMGAVAASAVPVYLVDSSSIFLLPAMLVLGALGGMGWAGIAACRVAEFTACSKFLPFAR
mgnify:CR=1 FL=1